MHNHLAAASATPQLPSFISSQQPDGPATQITDKVISWHRSANQSAILGTTWGGRA